MSGTSTESRGHSLERYQAPQLLRPANTVSAVDLKGSADASLAKFFIPSQWGTAEIIAMGFNAAAAGGAQTTAGTMVMEIGGTDVEDADGNDFVCASVASHAAAACVETELNSTTNNLTAPPSYPTATKDQLIELKVGTQGAGAGDQTVFPYIIARPKAGQS